MQPLVQVSASSSSWSPWVSLFPPPLSLSLSPLGCVTHIVYSRVTASVFPLAMATCETPVCVCASSLAIPPDGGAPPPSPLLNPIA